MKTRSKFYLVAVFQLIAYLSFGQVWDFVYDSIPTMGRQVILTNDSCFLATAVNNTFENDDNISIKLNQDGEIVWYSPNGGFSVTQTYDNQYVIAGCNEPYSVLKKINESGELEWYKTYSGRSRGEFTKVIQSSDSGIVACGFGYNNEDSTFLAIKTDSQGHPLWTTCFFSMDGNGFRDVIEFDHHYYFVGNEHGESYPPFYLYIAKVTMSGVPRWHKMYEIGHSWDCISVTLDSLLVVAGGNWITWLNTDGHTLKTKQVNAAWEIHSIDITPENGFIISGTKTQLYPESFLAELDPNGERIWSKSFPTVSQPYWGCFESVRCTEDGGFITCGYSLYASRYTTRFRVIKTDETGNILVGTDDINENKQFHIIPNPNDGRFSINIPGIKKIEVYDIEGKLVQCFSKAAEIDLRNHKSGIYLIRITTEEGIFVEKMIKR